MAYNKKKPVKKVGTRKMKPGGSTGKGGGGKNMVKGRGTTTKPMKKLPPQSPSLGIKQATELLTRKFTMGGKPSAGAIKMAEGILRAAGKKRYGGKNVPVKRRGGKNKK